MNQRQAQLDIDRLSDSDNRDLQQSINNEIQKAQFQEYKPVSSLLVPSARLLQNFLITPFYTLCPDCNPLIKDEVLAAGDLVRSWVTSEFCKKPGFEDLNSFKSTSSE